jgi:hypothetical protein
MNKPVILDLFAEDQGHEEVVGAIVCRVAKEEGFDIQIRVRRARGGHGRVINELKLYQKSVLGGVVNLTLPDILVVAIDANCKKHAAARREIEEALDARIKPLAAIACPNPHIERWCLVDPPSFNAIVGIEPILPRRKCAKDAYKSLLSDTVRKAGHVPTLGGIEFASELVIGMDLFRASRNDKSLKSFVEELRARLITKTSPSP